MARRKPGSHIVKDRVGALSDGAGDRDRTCGLGLTKTALYQLSYTSARPRLSEASAPWPLERLPMTGLEPITSPELLCQLSYIGVELEFGIEPKACAVRKHRSSI